MPDPTTERLAKVLAALTEREEGFPLDDTEAAVAIIAADPGLFALPTPERTQALAERLAKVNEAMAYKTSMVPVDRTTARHDRYRYGERLIAAMLAAAPLCDHSPEVIEAGEAWARLEATGLRLVADVIESEATDDRRVNVRLRGYPNAYGATLHEAVAAALGEEIGRAHV